MNNYNISIASDHAGFALKHKAISYLKSLGHNLIDLGTNNEFEKVDYPDYASALSEHLLSGLSDFGILICRSGIGMSIAANRFSGIRAALCTTPEVSELARLHNDANILVLSCLVVEDLNMRIIDKFLSTRFEGGRHIARLAKIS